MRESGKQDVPEVEKDVFFVCFFVTSAFSEVAHGFLLAPIPNRPLESHKTWLVVAWVSSSLMTAAQVKGLNWSMHDDNVIQFQRESLHLECILVFKCGPYGGCDALVHSVLLANDSGTSDLESHIVPDTKHVKA